MTVKLAPPQADRVLERVREKTGCVPRQTAHSQWRARCPAHDDHNPSLSIGVAEDGRVLLHCFAGCDLADVTGALGLHASDLYPVGCNPGNVSGAGQRAVSRARSAEHENTGKAVGHIAAVYPYEDTQGHLLFQQVRFDPKSFRQRRPDGSGGWVWNLNGVRRVLYRLPELARAVARGDWVFVVEGEKDVESLRDLGLAATTCPQGAGKWRPEYGRHLEGARVAILPDNDDPGRKHAAQVAAALDGVAADVRVVELPGLPEKGDVSDWLEAEGTAEKLLTLADSTPPRTPPPAPADAGTPAGRHPLTDSGNAERLVDRHGRDLRHSSELGWLEWDGARWRPDATGGIQRRIKDTVRSIPAEAENLDEDARAAVLRHAAKSESAPRRSAMEMLARCELPVTADELDGHPWLLNCRNGTVDLREMALRPHERAHMITQRVNANFDLEAPCQAFEAFLDCVFDGDRELIDFVARLVGLGLVGEQLERVLVILYGAGRNGKTVLREALLRLLGDYAISTPASTFVDRREGIPNDVARLRAKRLVVASESEEGGRLAVAQIKAMSGGDTLTARFLHKEFFEFVPQFLPLLVTNHRPRLPDGGDQAIWDRLLLLPFEVRIPDNLRRPKHELLAGFDAEADGILAWACLGLQDYLRNGLRPPECVRAATADYRSDENPIAEFVAERCELELAAESSSAALYDAYAQWFAETSKGLPLSRRKFAGALENLGCAKHKGTGGARIWRGIRLTLP